MTILSLLLLAQIGSTNPTTQFDVLLKQNNIPIDGVSGSGPNCRIDFQASATPAQIQQAQQLAQSFNWSAQPLPDVASFKQAVLTDQTIAKSPAALYNLIQLVALANDYKLNPSGVKSAWSAVVQTGWLTPAIQSLVEGYANTYNMPLK